MSNELELDLRMVESIKQHAAAMDTIPLTIEFLRYSEAHRKAKYVLSQIFKMKSLDDSSVERGPENCRYFIIATNHGAPTLQSVRAAMNKNCEEMATTLRLYEEEITRRRGTIFHT